MSTREVTVRKDSRLFVALCEALLRRGHPVQFTVRGQSMQPNLLDGDTVLVEPASPGKLRLGDVVLLQTSEGLRVHRVHHISSAGLTTRGDAGIDIDPRTLHVFGKVVSRSRGSRAQSFHVLQTRFLHPLRSVSHRLRIAAAIRLRRATSTVFAAIGLLLLLAVAFSPVASAQTADLQLTQTASSPAVATNATTQSLNTSTAVTWTGGIATFTFPTSLPSGVFPNALLTTAGFAPSGYNLTNASITSVNYATGAVSVALSNQSLGTATNATWVSNVASFTFPMPLPSFAVVGAMLTTTGCTPASYNVTGATITSVNGMTGVVTVALPAQSLGTSTAAVWQNNGGGRLSFSFPTPLPSNAVVGGLLITTGFAPAAYNVTNAVITSITAGGAVRVALATNPGVSTALGTGTSGPGSSTTSGTGTVDPPTPSTFGTGSVPSGYAYSEVVTNNSSGATVTSGTITAYLQTPANTIFESAFGNNWTCTTPAVGGTGPIICTYNTTLVTGATASALTLGFQIPAGTAAGTTIQSSATVTNSTFVDPVPSNNTSITSIFVEPATTSDLGVSLSVSPTPVFISSNLTYSIQVQNFGQASAPVMANVFSDPLPSGVTFASISVPSGWSCSTPAVGSTGTVSCSLTSAMPASPASGSTATIAITVSAPATATTLTNTATVSLAGDPNSANNSATAFTVVQPLACASPGRDGTAGTLTGIVNTYFPPATTGTLASASNSVTLAAAAAGGAQTPIASGDLLLIIQTQGATINSNNTGSYGDGVPGDPGSGFTALGSSGLFEFVTATNSVPVTGGTVTFSATGPTGGLLNSYSFIPASSVGTTFTPQQTYQVIRAPQYSSATLSSGLVPLAWNGSVGGVLVLDVSSQLTLGGTVSLDALGFRGGGGRALRGTGTGTRTDYVTSATNLANGSKGEGIAGTPRFVVSATVTNTTTATDAYTGTLTDALPNRSYARGAPGNAGGGGTDGDPVANTENSGGGGGGNGATGGQGGYGWNSLSATNSTDGGFGGVAFPASMSALVMGGGGGAGTTNNGSFFISAASNGADCGASCTGIFSSGGIGGGIAIVHAGSIAGTGTITANGQSTLSTLNDATGGGGAGGSILVFANSGGLGGLTVNANGGSGGNAWPNQAPSGFPGQRHGPGGGGGGGVIFLTASPANSSVSGGSNGFTNTVQDSFGATSGSAGVVATAHVITETPGTQSGAFCGSADLAVTNSGSPSVVAPGGTIVYTQVVTNNGPLDAVNAVFSEAIPASTTFVSLPAVSGWNCTVPAVGATGNITCTNPLFAKGATSTFILSVQVNGGTASGTQIVDVANIISGTSDPDLTNNSATAIVTVGAVGTADLQVVNTASSPTTVAGNNVTMTAVVTNLGPSTASGPSFTETVPTNTTVGATFVAPLGWLCNSLTAGSPAGTVLTCTISSLAAGGTATFPLVLNVNSGTAAGTLISATADVTSTTPDPNSVNNESTATTTVATAGQSDLAVTSSALPNPVTQGNNITYTQAVTNNGPAAATVATFTDTIPAGTTFVSLPQPANWTCSTPAVGGTGTVSCTLNAGQNIAVGASVNFPLVVNVNLATASGATITNTANINVPCSSVADPNCANNSASTSVIVASPSQADVAIVKTASPEPVNQGTNLTYTLAVSNNGPAVANNVNVSDDIPSTVTYVSASSTQGTCSTTPISVSSPYVSTLQVNCSLGTVSVGAQIVVTINVTATTLTGSGPSTVNTATVTSSTSDPNLANNSSSATSNIQSPTAVGLASFNAFRQSDGTVLLEWHTHEESRNLGFHVYREDSSGRHRVDSSLIAGSALLLRGSRPQHAAKTYHWIDSQPVVDAIYWIEDVDINGTRTLHGPASVRSATFAPSDVGVMASSHLLQASAQPQHAALNKSVGPALRPISPLPIFPAPPIGVPRLTIADHAAVKIGVDQEGWYSVPLSQLHAAGLDPNTDPRTLHLFAEGIEQPLLLSPSSGPGSSPAIEFYGIGRDTPFSGTRVYWLVHENGAPHRILLSPESNSGTPAPSSFPFSVIREDRIVCFAALLNGENNDNFFGAVVTSDPVDQALLVTHFDPASTQPVSLDVSLQGATDTQFHRVSVQFNGSLIGELDFFGEAAAVQTFSLDPSLLIEGTNTVTLTALEGDNDISVVKSVELHFPHTYTADADWLRATAPAGSSLQITGFTNPAIRAFDITDPLNIAELPGKISVANGVYQIAVNLALSAEQQRTILAFAEDAVSSPSSLMPHRPSFLDDRRAGADIVMIAHPDFVSSLAPLVRLRESQGHRVQLVTTDQIFDEYNFGERSPFAIRAFLQDAVAHWNRKPQSVFLVGGASFDPRNYLGQGFFDFVPTRMIQTAAFKTASDDWFTDFQQNGFPTIPTGRLPVRTAADADLAVSKIVNYEQRASAGSWNAQAVFIADQNVDSNFSSAAAAAAANLPPGIAATRILTDGLDPATARAQILSALNDGALLVNYDGHGAEQQWSFSDIFDTNDAQSLTNGGRLPVYLLMDCLNGFFQDIYVQSLAESILLAPNGGGVAAWASSGFTQQPPQATMNQALLRQFQLHPHDSLGRLILDAKSGTTDNDVRRTWILFGDPAMRLQIGTSVSAGSAFQKLLSLPAPPAMGPVCAAKLPCLKEKPSQ